MLRGAGRAGGRQAEFLQEVQVLGGCRHEHLLPLIGFAADGDAEGRGGVCLVLPLMKGGSVEDRLFPPPERQPLQPPLTWQERVYISLSVAKALLYLHTPDPALHKPAILHRNLKPANVLLDADGHVRVADVGLARIQRSDRTHLTLTQVRGKLHDTPRITYT